MPNYLWKQWKLWYSGSIYCSGTKPPCLFSTNTFVSRLLTVNDTIEEAVELGQLLQLHQLFICAVVVI